MLKDDFSPVLSEVGVEDLIATKIFEAEFKYWKLLCSNLRVNGISYSGVIDATEVVELFSCDHESS